MFCSFLFLIYFEFQIISMNFQDLWLGLGLLFISVNAEFLGDGAEMEDFDENSEETNVNAGEHSSEVR